MVGGYLLFDAAVATHTNKTFIIAQHSSDVAETELHYTHTSAYIRPYIRGSISYCGQRYQPYIG